jgi:Cupin domain
VLEGSFEVVVDGTWRALGPGASASVPRGALHTFRNRSGAVVRVHHWHRPAKRFEELIEPTSQTLRAAAIKSKRDPRVYMCLSKVMLQFDDPARALGPRNDSAESSGGLDRSRARDARAGSRAGVPPRSPLPARATTRGGYAMAATRCITGNGWRQWIPGSATTWNGSSPQDSPLETAPRCRSSSLVTSARVSCHTAWHSPAKDARSPRASPQAGGLRVGTVGWWSNPPSPTVREAAGAPR